MVTTTVKIDVYPNGFILWTENDDGEFRGELYETSEGSSIYDSPKQCRQRAEKVKELLYSIISEIGELYGKHSPYYIDIKVRKNPEYPACCGSAEVADG